MSELFTLDVMVGYVLPVQDEPCLFPAVTLKLYDFPKLTVHCIPPSEQQGLKKKYLLSNKIGFSGSQNRIVFKKGKSCSFKLTNQDAQKFCLPLTIMLNDVWYLPMKELARTCIDILVPQFKQGSVIHPINSSKQLYELCNATGSKVAMVELSYKLNRVQTSVTNIASDHKVKPIVSKENPSKDENLEKSMHTKETSFLQKKVLCTDNIPVSKLFDELTVCPPPLLYSANSDNEQVKLQSEMEPVTSQDVSQVVWPNGYVHADPGWSTPKKDNFDTFAQPSSSSVPPIAQDGVSFSDNQNFWVLRTLVKELSTMEHLIKSKGVNPPVKKCNNVYVQTDNCSSSSEINNDKSTTPTEIVNKKVGRKKTKFTRECCTVKLGHSLTNQPRKVNSRHIGAPQQDKITSPRVKTVQQVISPRNKTTPLVLCKSRTRKVKIRPPPKQKPPPQMQLDSAVSRVSQVTGDEDPKNNEQASEEFSVNTSVEHKGEQSKLNLEIYLPALTKIPSTCTSTTNLKQQDNVISSTVDDATAPGLLTVPAADSITPSVIPMASALPLTSASQSEHLTLASSNDVKSYTNLSLLSESSEDVLNQSHISNVMFSTKHLEAVLADDRSTTIPASDHDKPSTISPATSSSNSESVQYKDDFESSDCSSKETLSSNTS